MVIRVVTYVLCFFCASSAMPGTIVGLPQPALPSPGSTASITPPILIGPKTYLLPINVISLDVTSPAYIHFTTDGLPGSNTYIFPFAFSNQSTDTWDSYSIELVAGEQGSALSLSTRDVLRGITLVKVEHTLLVDDQNLASGNSRSTEFVLQFDETPPPSAFSLKFTPVAEAVPEPGTAALSLLLAPTFCRRRRR